MKRLTLLFLLLWTFACIPPPPEYKSFGSDMSYKLLKFGEGQRVESGKRIMLYLSVLDQKGDTLHYVPDYPYFLAIKDRPIDSIFMKFGKGDSAHLRLPRNQFNEYLKFYKVLQADTGEVELRISVQNVLDSLDADLLKKKVLSERELKEQLELKGYLSSFPDSVEYFEGVYRSILEQNPEGRLIRYGDEVSISYKGRFLNGYVFDNTDDKGISPTFRFGEDYQLIEGVESGLKGLREGESVKIILPSRRAFGEEGSLAGIVPPYTAVVFDIKILNIE